MYLADIIGIGRTKTAEHWGLGLVDLAVKAASDALEESGSRPTAVVVANSLGGTLGDQRNLAAFVAARLGLKKVETHTVEADEASGGAAVRLALALNMAGIHEQVLVIGAEKPTDALPDVLDAARANSLDVLREAGFGIGLSVAAALAMQRYIEKHRVDRRDFYHLSAVAHAHGAKNKLAFFPWALSEEQYFKAPLVADPVTVCDTAPPCDGAAAVIIGRPTAKDSGCVHIAGSAAVSYPPNISSPALELALPAARDSAEMALSQAQLSLDDISLFELHDSSTVMAALSLEAVGIAEPGRALEMAKSGALDLEGKYPTWTFGGHKSRGHTLGAAGLYQLVEATMQLRNEAGANQVREPSQALVQCLGSFGATAVTHVLSR